MGKYPIPAGGLTMEDPARRQPGETLTGAVERLRAVVAQREVQAYEGDREAAAKALGISVEELEGLQSNVAHDEV